eukprot:COSAG01_NODE_52_length_31456_cov_125.226648_30_plen_471_part_00
MIYQMNTKKALVWFRRDLRLHDHHALSQACQDYEEINLVFVFDKNILDPLKKKDKQDRRLQFICEALAEIQESLKIYNTHLLIRYGEPKDIIPKLAKEKQIESVYWNRDYTSYALDRDNHIKKELAKAAIKYKDFQDHVLIEPNRLLNQQERPYHVFTPYAKAWKTQLKKDDFARKIHTVKLNKQNKIDDAAIKTVSALLNYAGFEDIENELKGGSKEGLKRLNAFERFISSYKEQRNYPAIDKTSKLSVYIRHGCISVRDMLKVASSQSDEGHQTWLNELIWREFYQMIAHHYPQVKDQSFKDKYKTLKFPGSEERLAAWKKGETGYPIIDAAMRCLNQTGWMHNRLRMVTASFLCKIALVDWRRGERYFAWKLLDYDFASNNGGWQWASSTGCDAAPYFRIFNPETQSKTYDKDGEFIRKYCPELGHLKNKEIHNPSDTNRSSYHKAICNYKENRQKALDLYKNQDKT